MAERVSSFTKFPGVFATELNGRKVALSLHIQPRYSASDTSLEAGELTAKSVKAGKVLTSAVHWNVSGRINGLSLSCLVQIYTACVYMHMPASKNYEKIFNG